jgi:hypothetical protein
MVSSLEAPESGVDWAHSGDRPDAVFSLGFALDFLLTRFAPITLDAIKSVASANRLDTKSTFGMAELPQLLRRIAPHYSLLTINGVRAQRYQTLYFDTPGLDLYLRHHNGVYPRHKIRCRRYVDSERCFFEIKTKSNTGRTFKQRIPSPGMAVDIAGQARTFLQRAVPHLPAVLRPVIRVDFTRLTLANKDATERVTIDLDLTCHNSASSSRFPNLVIAEVKRDRSAARSLFLQKLHEMHLPEGSISKYCLGIMALHAKIKQNRFKERLREINKLAA